MEPIVDQYAVLFVMPHAKIRKVSIWLNKKGFILSCDLRYVNGKEKNNLQRTAI